MWIAAGKREDCKVSEVKGRCWRRQHTHRPGLRQPPLPRRVLASHHHAALQRTSVVRSITRSGPAEKRLLKSDDRCDGRSETLTKRIRAPTNPDRWDTRMDMHAHKHNQQRVRTRRPRNYLVRAAEGVHHAAHHASQEQQQQQHTATKKRTSGRLCEDSHRTGGYPLPPVRQWS